MKLRRLLFSGLLFTAFSFAATQANAQAGRFGINAGANFSNITGKDASKNNKIKTGIQAGVTYDIGVADEFVVQPGLSYVQNGTKGAWNGLTGDVKLNYIQLPVTFQYQPELGSGHLLLGVGPYVGMGIGKVKIGKTEYSYEAAKMKKWDAGGKLLVGYQTASGISLNLNANLGLIKLSDVSNPPVINNTSFGLTLGYKL